MSSSSEWRRGIQEVDAAVFQHLRTGIEGGFDEESFAQRIGFGNLKWCPLPRFFGALEFSQIETLKP